MTAAPAVSVVIPFHGRTTALLREAVASAQATGGAQVIVVDDASPAPADAAALPPCANGTVEVVRQPTNAGPGQARNVGLSRARAPFIAFLDADDRFAPGYLDHALGLLRERTDMAAVCAPADYMDPAGRALGSRAVAPEGPYVAGDLVANRFLLQTCVGRESVLRSVPFSHRYRGEDHEYFYRLAAAGHVLWVSHGPAVDHRCGLGDSVTRSDVRRDLADRLSVMESLCQEDGSGEAYMARLVGDRLLGLACLAVAEGHVDSMQSLVDLASAEQANVVLLPPPRSADLESRASFFAAKQFGRPLRAWANPEASIECAAMLLRLANDYTRPVFYRLITGWWHEAGRGAQWLPLLGARLLRDMPGKLLPSADAASGPALLACRRANSPYSLWRLDTSVQGPSAWPQGLKREAALDAVFGLRVLSYRELRIAASPVARSLLLSGPLRGGAAVARSDHCGGWKLDAH